MCFLNEKFVPLQPEINYTVKRLIAYQPNAEIYFIMFLKYVNNNYTL